MKPEVIIIHETLAQSIARDIATFATFVGMVGVGVWLGSTALQWVGAVFAFMIVALKAGQLSKRMTIADARKYLDSLEASE